MEASRKPLAKVEGRKRMRLSGLTVVWRGTPSLDDWLAYIAKSQPLVERQENKIQIGRASCRERV